MLDEALLDATITKFGRHMKRLKKSIKEQERNMKTLNQSRADDIRKAQNRASARKSVERRNERIQAEREAYQERIRVLEENTSLLEAENIRLKNELAARP